MVKMILKVGLKYQVSFKTRKCKWRWKAHMGVMENNRIYYRNGKDDYWLDTSYQDNLKQVSVSADGKSRMGCK